MKDNLIYRGVLLVNLYNIGGNETMNYWQKHCLHPKLQYTNEAKEMAILCVMVEEVYRGNPGIASQLRRNSSGQEWCKNSFGLFLSPVWCDYVYLWAVYCINFTVHISALAVCPMMEVFYVVLTAQFIMCGVSYCRILSVSNAHSMNCNWFCINLMCRWHLMTSKKDL